MDKKSNLEKIKELERREIFRTYFIEPIEAIGRIISINNQKVSLDKYMKMKIIDLSAGGAQIATYLNIPKNNEVIIHIGFELEGQNFEFESMIVWENRRNTEKYYGLKFLNLTDKEIEILIQKLNMYQTQNKKYKKIITKEKTSKYERLKPIIKTIDIIPYPVYIINEDQEILATNTGMNANNSFNEVRGKKCYEKIFGREEACNYCKFMECKERENQIMDKVQIGYDFYNISWLQIEAQVFLHHFQKL